MVNWTLENRGCKGILIRLGDCSLAISLEQGLPWVILIEDLLMPTDRRQTLVGMHQLRVGLSWMDPLVSFLKDEVLPDDRGEAENI